MGRRNSEPDALESATLGPEPDVRVLVVDDQDFFRGVLCELVSATPGFTVVGEAAGGAEAVRATTALSPEFVLMDVRMPGLGGVAAARRMLERHPHLVVLLVSAQDLPEAPRGELSGLGVSFAHKRDLGGGLLRAAWDGRDDSGERPRVGAPT